LFQKSSKEEEDEEFTDLVIIKLDNFLDTQYTGVLSVGNSDNKLNVVFDTGSTLLWVNSVRCKDPECA